MTGLFQDLRYGLRQLRKSPVFTSVAVLTLGLGIGANTAIFTVVNSILLRPLPYSRPSELVSIQGTYPKGAFVAMREQIRTMAVAAYAEGYEFNLTHIGEPVRLTGTAVSAELFSVLGAHPELGRTFTSGEDRAGSDNYVVLSHALWEQRFGRDPAIVGRSIELEGVNRQVLGVMPASFHFPSDKAQLWVPLHCDPRNSATFWAGDFMPVIARLRPGVSVAEASAEIKLFQSHVFALFPWTMPANWNADVTLVNLRNGMVAEAKTRLLLLLGSVALVLLIACANVANLMLVRAATREKEMAIRSALGAGPRRLVRQLLTENILLALIGAALGLAIAASGLSALKGVLPADTPRLLEVHINWQVLAFTASLAVLTGLAFGLTPALQFSRSAVADSLNASGRGSVISVSQRLRGALATTEVGLAVLLVVSAGLLIRSFWGLSHVDPGFRPQQLLTARITPNQSLCSEPAKCLAFYHSLLDQARSSPGVSDAALVNTLPLGGRVAKRSFDLEDTTDSSSQVQPLFWLVVVTTDYFRVMGIPLISGRWFTEGDESGGPPVVVVTAGTARRFWGDRDVIGKHVRFVGETEWRTIVGVVGDVRAYDLQRSEPDFMRGTAYVPYTAKATLEDGRVPAEMTLAARTALNFPDAGILLRNTLTALNPEVPISEVRSMHLVVSEAASTPASTSLIFSTFAAVALILGVVGVYGVLSYLVTRRAREMGIRMALGARRVDVLLLVMKEGAKYSFGGITLGLAGALLGTRFLESQLYGVGPVDLMTYCLVSTAVAVVTLAACYVPARRATKIDPMVALRYE